MQSTATGLNCPKCGLRSIKGSEFCPACGLEFSKSSESRGDKYHASTDSSLPIYNFNLDVKHRHTNSSRTYKDMKHVNSSIPIASEVQNGSSRTSSQGGIEYWLGFRSISGVVIFVEGPYQMKKRSHFAVTLAKTLLGVVVFFVAGSAILAWSLFSSFSLFTRPISRQSNSSFASESAKQMSISYVMSKMFGIQEGVTVRDIRVRDLNQKEYLVRVQGELVAGNFNIGDEVDIVGFNRQGTLIFQSGWNRRTSTKIIAKV